MQKPRGEQERAFRALVRSLISSGKYPEHRAIVPLLGRPPAKWKSGLSVQQGLWRIAELEAAGFDWERSRKDRKLIKKS